jgi:hypothetical protein
MDSDKEHKQNFLREEILEKEYDPDDFLAFIVTKKGDDAADLDLWTFQELKDVNIK